MKDSLKHLAFEVEIQHGEKLALPPRLVECVGSGRWVITVQPADDARGRMRGHGAFLAGYAPEDEGLYDDHAGR